MLVFVVQKALKESEAEEKDTGDDIRQIPDLCNQEKSPGGRVAAVESQTDVDLFPGPWIEHQTDP